MCYSGKKQGGFTLVEVIISMAIISAIAAAFIMVFGGGFTNIFAMGARSEAKSLAAQQMEMLYAAPPPLSRTAIITMLEGEGGFHVTGTDNLYLPRAGKDFNFSVISFQPRAGITGNKVIIVYFYHAGERHTTLTAYIRGG
jgi:prepilin-type N-terminal cleavage/methylation domain-containing protein